MRLDDNMTEARRSNHKESLCVEEGSLEEGSAREQGRETLRMAMQSRQS
jgi:hypothetical protein